MIHGEATSIHTIRASANPATAILFFQQIEISVQGEAVLAQTDPQPLYFDQRHAGKGCVSCAGFACSQMSSVIRHAHHRIAYTTLAPLIEAVGAPARLHRSRNPHLRCFGVPKSLLLPYAHVNPP
jgi:hypothetical protein